MSDHLSLYQFDACPFCARVRAAIKDLGIDVEIRDTQRDPERHRELVEGGGRGMVPCLRIDSNGHTDWLYESEDIIAYLRRRFGS